MENTKEIKAIIESLGNMSHILETMKETTDVQRKILIKMIES